jgi:plastocyanin/methionine-rich copper-binding protein CopC
MKKALLVTIPIILVIGAAVIFVGRDTKNTNSTTEKKTPHYESSTPANDMVLAAPPPNVTIDFNFDLAGDSSIEIAKDGKAYGSGETSIDENKLALRRSMKQDAPDGSYLVKYTACWPDGSCHDGQFSFRIDRTKANAFTDMRGQKEITVKMSHIMFEPRELRISKDTKVTWVNDDGAIHYVNTDSHPAHTHIPGFNSKALNKGGSYSFTFNETGAYPYHCSAHAATMTAMIVVE